MDAPWWKNRCLVHSSKFESHMSPVWTAVGKYILSLSVKRKSSECKEGLQMAITCNEQRRQRWTNRVKKTKKKRNEEKKKETYF